MHGMDPPGLGREKGGHIEVWAGVTRKAEVVVWKKSADGTLTYFTLFSVTTGKQESVSSLCSARTVSKIQSF